MPSKTDGNLKLYCTCYQICEYFLRNSFPYHCCKHYTNYNDLFAQEGKTIVGSTTQDIIQETRKLNIRRKGSGSNSNSNQQNEATGKWGQPYIPRTQTDYETQLKASRDVRCSLSMCFLSFELPKHRTVLSFCVIKSIFVPLAKQYEMLMWQLQFQLQKCGAIANLEILLEVYIIFQLVSRVKLCYYA